MSRTLACLALWVCACSPRTELRQTPWTEAAPLGLPPVPVSAKNPMTVEKVDLGRLLFYDRRVASQPHSSCADCHPPDHGYAGREATMAFHRNSPTVWNRAYGNFEFWDGSAGRSLESLVDGVLRFVNFDAKKPVGERLAAIPGYRVAFQRAFGHLPERESIAQAIACYCRTLLTGDSPYDRFVAGDKKAMGPSAQLGAELFLGKAGCSSCHSGPNFTDELFHDIGIGQENPEQRFYPPDRHGKPDFPELGRFNVSHRLEDRGAFKTPTLRQLVDTGPYMHDGRFGTLEQVVDYYNRGGLKAIGVDPRIHPLGLSGAEQFAMVDFLRALSTNKPPPPVPELPPQ